MADTLGDQWNSNMWLYSPEYKQVFYEKAQKIIDSKGDQLTYTDFNSIDIIHPGQHDGIQEFFAQYPQEPGAKVLEVGPGLGCTSRYIHINYGVEVFGVEYLDHFTEGCNFINEKLGLQDKIHVHTGDIVTENVNENFYDLAVATVAFMYIRDTNGLRNVAKALKPGGVFFLEDYFFVKPRDQWDENDREMIEYRGMCGVRHREEVCELLESFGMEIVTVIECGRYWAENSWKRAQECHDLGLTDRSKGSHFHQYAVISPQLKCDLDHLSMEEIRKRFPDVANYFDVEDLVFRKPKLTTGLRVIARKK